MLRGRMNRFAALFAAGAAIAGVIAFAAPTASARLSSPIVEGGSLTIIASPNPLRFGQATALSGTLKGTSIASQPVTLQAEPAPFAGGFQEAGTTTTDGAGRYLFKDLKPALNTKYRVVAATCPGPIACCALDTSACCASNPSVCCPPVLLARGRVIPCCVNPRAARSSAPIICPLDVIPCPVVAVVVPDPCSPGAVSPELLVKVRIKVVLHLGDPTPAAGKRVRFYGTATPAHDGQPVFIQRRKRNGHWRTVKTTLLADAGNELSSFNTSIRVNHAGTYRARVHHDADHAGGKSKRKRTVVH
jgi:hypothetical protein